MRFRGLSAAVVILLVLGGVLYWSNRHKPSENASSSNSGASPAIVHIDPATVTSFTVKQKDAAPVTVDRSAPGKWQITAPLAAPADSTTVSAMLSSLSPLNSQRVVEDKAADLAPFGLNNPSVELDIAAKNNTRRLLLGDAAPTGDAVYVAVAGDPRVYTAPSYIKTSLNKSLDDLRDKRFLPVDSSAVSGIQLIRKGENIGFGRIQNGWQIDKPQPYRTDSYQVDDLLQQIVGSKWASSGNEQDNTKAFDHGTQVATVKITGSSGTNTLDVREDRNSYYVKSSALAGIYPVDPSIAGSFTAALQRPLDEFRNKQLFDFGYTDPDKIEYHSGTTGLLLTHTDNDWWSGGKKMDADSVEALVSAMRDLAAQKFVDSGFNSPQFDLTVTSDGGKKVEKASFRKTSDGAIAKRDDGPSLYFMDANTMNTFHTAVSGIKPAATPKKK